MKRTVAFVDRDHNNQSDYDRQENSRVLNKNDIDHDNDNNTKGTKETSHDTMPEATAAVQNPSLFTSLRDCHRRGQPTHPITTAALQEETQKELQNQGEGQPGYIRQGAASSKSSWKRWKGIPLPASFEPSPLDVICGRGKACFSHPGNRAFRQSIADALKSYQTCDSKLVKGQMVTGIVEDIRSGGGGFVRYDLESRMWYDIGDEAAREKVGQTIREALVQRDPNRRIIQNKKRAANKRKRIARAHGELLDGTETDNPMQEQNQGAAVRSTMARSFGQDVVSSRGEATSTAMACQRSNSPFKPREAARLSAYRDSLKALSRNEGVLKATATTTTTDANDETNMSTRGSQQVTGREDRTSEAVAGTISRSASPTRPGAASGFPAAAVGGMPTPDLLYAAAGQQLPGLVGGVLAPTGFPSLALRQQALFSTTPFMFSSQELFAMARAQQLREQAHAMRTLDGSVGATTSTARPPQQGEPGQARPVLFPLSLPMHVMAQSHDLAMNNLFMPTPDRGVLSDDLAALQQAAMQPRLQQTRQQRHQQQGQEAAAATISTSHRTNNNEKERDTE